MSRRDRLPSVENGAPPSAESARLASDAARKSNWKRWGPYLSERQWGTVREDYSTDGDCWNYLPHDHARSRAYRWGEDGLLGVTDRQCRLCFALALWNGKDPILKERLFGLTGPEGNHGEDVKEEYFYLDSTPTHSFMKALYKYPHAEFPYARLVEENRRRGRDDPEFELADTGIFDESRYFDVFAEYAKAGPDDLCVRITVANRGPQVATINVLPTLWFRNTWSWGCGHEGCTAHERPALSLESPGVIRAAHPTLGGHTLRFEADARSGFTRPLFTDNETNAARLFASENVSPFVKDAFHEALIRGRSGAVNPANTGTKVAAQYVLVIPPGEERVIRLRLTSDVVRVAPGALGSDFDRVFADRQRECDEFYASRVPGGGSGDAARVARQAYAGLLWSKQFYHSITKEWLEGDQACPPPPGERKTGRNADWPHLFNRDIISMPDKWEYPWYAAWDLAFHMIPFANVDPHFAKEQLLLLLREWYMHPSGQIPAYEFAFGDVNPPVHAWAVWRVYKMTGEKGRPETRDRLFLARCFHKLMLNFTWWVNRKDPSGKNIFAGGFLGLDNIGVFDRSRPLPTGGHLEQADGTAWMAFYCGTMLSIALELARHEPAYEDIASKFFEHFVAITDAINTVGGSGLWDEHDGFFYDQLNLHGRSVPLKVRSLVGVVPLLAVEVLEDDAIDALPGFKKRMEWFLANRADLARHISYMEHAGHGHGAAPAPGTGAGADAGHRLLAIPSKDRLVRTLRYILDETEFLSPYGVRSLSRVHRDSPYVFRAAGEEFRVDYTPGESTTGLFGGNSNWRGPVWFPLNFLLVEALERYHHFYGDSIKVEFPTGSGRELDLAKVADELRRRLSSLFLANDRGCRPCHGQLRSGPSGRHSERFATDPHWKDLVLFHEYFHAETGKGLGASHQTGWTALVAPMLASAGRSARAHAEPARRMSAVTTA